MNLRKYNKKFALLYFTIFTENDLHLPQTQDNDLKNRADIFKMWHFFALASCFMMKMSKVHLIF
ncbi:hypothetical protein D7Z26_21140 [Cohnella endophytica]|uniref:Uncharacterized protein n=1 Tax=Cohnella endophytica TaxID=2419778 RepID=A0A494XEC2_9BACL|nr:hypothetical protein D7Z26_21140 [Cohnella endophytica]